MLLRRAEHQRVRLAHQVVRNPASGARLDVVVLIICNHAGHVGIDHTLTFFRPRSIRAIQVVLHVLVSTFLLRGHRVFHAWMINPLPLVHYGLVREGDIFIWCVVECGLYVLCPVVHNDVESQTDAIRVQRRDARQRLRVDFYDDVLCCSVAGARRRRRRIRVRLSSYFS